MNAFRRFFLRWHWMLEYERSLNRRAKVEEQLHECARGKRPLPDKDQCRQWAHDLGTPEAWKC